MLEPEEVVEYLRLLRERMPPIEPLTKRQRKLGQPKKRATPATEE